MQGEDYNFEILKIPGTKKYQSQYQMFIPNCHILCVCIDVANKDSYERAESLLKDVEQINRKVPFYFTILVGCK